MTFNKCSQATPASSFRVTAIISESSPQLLLTIPNTRHSSLHRQSLALPWMSCQWNPSVHSFLNYTFEVHLYFSYNPSSLLHCEMYFSFLSCWWAIGSFPLWRHYEQNSHVHLCPRLLVDIGIQISCAYTLENCWIIQVDVYIYFIRICQG